MKAEVALRVVLTLEEEEAYWLKAVMQNPLFGREPSEESEKDRDMRKNIFSWLNDALDEA